MVLSSWISADPLRNRLFEVGCIVENERLHLEQNNCGLNVAVLATIADTNHWRPSTSYDIPVSPEPWVPEFFPPRIRRCDAHKIVTGNWF